MIDTTGKEQVTRNERRQLLDATLHHDLVRRVARLLATFAESPEHAMKTEVLVNMLSVIARGDAQDFEQTAALTRRYGHQLVAEVQDGFDDVLKIGPHLPCTTATIVRLSRRSQIRDLLLDAGRSEPEAEQVANDCAKAAFRLLLAGVDNSLPRPMPTSAVDLQRIVEKRGADVWRRMLATVAANPWGPAVAYLADLARTAELPEAADAIEGCAKVFRKRIEEAERLEVAREIRRLVAISGCSQRTFAKYVGTSAPRLSTYVNGLVTPSAAMMYRMNRLANALAQGAPWKTTDPAYETA